MTQEIKDNITIAFNKVLPNFGLFISNHALGDGFSVSGLVGANKSEWQNGIHNNDALNLTMHYWTDSRTLECTCYFSVKSENPHRYSESVKLRKVTIKTFDVKSLESYFKKIKTLILENQSIWLNNDVALLNKKLAVN